MITETETKIKINSYLSFMLGDEVFASNVSKVLNILEMCKITKIPKSPPYMKGVINLRGKVLPLVDTRVKFELPPTEFTANTCILVLDIEIDDESVMVGALVDSVQEVLEIKDNEIQPAPNVGKKYRSEFIQGMFLADDGFYILLEMDKIFSIDDRVVLKESVKYNITEKNTEVNENEKQKEKLIRNREAKDLEKAKTNKA